MTTLHSYRYAINERSIRRGVQTLRHSHSILPTEPVPVGHKRQLLMDRHVVDDLNGATRSVQQPLKHPANPLLQTGPLRDGLDIFTAGARMTREDGVFRMWAQAFDRGLLQELGEDHPQVHQARYFESKDGLEWYEPSLGLVDYRGSRDNNIVRYGVKGPMVFELPERLRDRGRYAMYYEQGIAEVPEPEVMHNEHYMIAYSDDRLHWTDAEENPLIVGRDKSGFILYDEALDLFRLYTRATINAGEIRRIAYMESADLVSWTQLTNILEHDADLDARMWYGMPVVRYNDLYLGFLWCLHTHADPDHCELGNGKDHRMDIQLTWSRDGRTWDRHPKRPTFLPNSPGVKGTYDWARIRTAADVFLIGDEVHVYYEGETSVHAPGDATTRGTNLRNFCLATLRRDRFVSVGASSSGGLMLTRPIAYPGGKLHINARTGANGFIRVAAREALGVRDGEWPEGFRFDDSRPFSGDNLDAILTWEGHETLASFPANAMRLHFWLEDAELFSFWFE